MEKVKLVIWDLDETFWKGTLSEGEVFEPHIELVKKLTKYGIINSICSKNDLEQTRKKLQDLGIWDYFVFPVINWNPKGEAVKGIISDCQLRAPNVVFIDDNKTNIGEVVHYNPDIMTYSDVESFERDLDWDIYNKDDDGKRLAQYKLLEKKKEYREECSSNIDFLLKSNIRIQFISDFSSIKERVVEMIERTNQLNFTKQRIDLPKLQSLLDDTRNECRAIRVIDNFGDYGICGFYVYSKETNKLNHFLFSCRILNLGVENYVYQKLGKPLIDIVQPVSAKLTDEKVTWIHEYTGSDVDPEEKQSTTFGNKIKIVLLGGCDLDQLVHYLSPEKFDILKDFNYTGKLLQTIHREHTIYLRAANTGMIQGAIKDELFSLPFLDSNAFNYHTLNEEYDYLVFSPLMNYTQELYKHNKLPIEVAYGGYTDITKVDELPPFTKEELESFKSNYCFMGQQDPNSFKNDLEWLLNNIKAKVIFLNGAEVKVNNPKEIGAEVRHKLMNAVLLQFVQEHQDRCYLVDVNNYVRSIDDIADNIRHYKRTVYIELARDIMRICLPDDKININKLSVAKQWLKYYLVKLNRIIKK